MIQDETGIGVVQAWHDALNSGDFDRLMTLMHEDVAFGGPRGEGHGAAEVRDWAERSGIHLEPERWFGSDSEVVVAQRARWRSVDSGELGPPDDIASAFQLRDGLIQRVARYGGLREALAVAGIDASDEWVLTAPAASGALPGVAPAVINLEELPYTGSSHELEGYLHGNAPVCVIFFNGPPGSGPRLHRHPYAEVFIVQAGNATFTIGDVTMEVTAGQIAIAPAGVPHKFVNTGPGPLLQIDIHANDRFETEWLED